MISHIKILLVHHRTFISPRKRVFILVTSVPLHLPHFPLIPIRPSWPHPFLWTLQQSGQNHASFLTFIPTMDSSFFPHQAPENMLCMSDAQVWFLVLMALSTSRSDIYVHVHLCTSSHDPNLSPRKDPLILFLWTVLQYSLIHILFSSSSTIKISQILLYPKFPKICFTKAKALS